MEQALADEARELRAELEAEKRDARRKASFRNQSPSGRQNIVKDLQSPDASATSFRRASIAGTNTGVPSPTSSASATTYAPVNSRLDPHTSFQKRRVDPDEDFNFGMRTAPVERPVIPDPPVVSKPPVVSEPPTPKPAALHPKVRQSKRSSDSGVRPSTKAMSMVYGKKKASLPGDLGPNDPRRKSDAASSTSPRSRIPHPSNEPSTKARRASDGALIKKARDDDEGGVRLNKDYDEAVGSSDDEYEGDTDASTDARRGRDRGRKNTRAGRAVGSRDDSEDSDVNRGRGGSATDPPLSPDPTITVTPPVLERRKSDVHPHSAYDHAGSATSTPRHSDDEEHLSDLRRAQRLSLTVSPIHSTPSAHRVIRQIIRGDYALFQREAEEGRRRQRVYLVATDLSPEAEYALEWTIGTVLRDGDTLLALYAVDEEGGTGASEGVEIGHGADVVKDTASIVGSLPAERVAQSPAPSPLGKLQREGSTARVPDEKGGMGKAERERYQAAESISDRCVKLLRKTRLQIRVVVEVFHCKSPRHMITEVIDFLSPTLTILGSRGRSALKGVLLGSFSNYLVTKSSVPVMVARRRLRKHSKQRLHKDGLPMAGTGDGRMRLGRMSNVLEAPGGSAKRVNRLAGAKID